MPTAPLSQRWVGRTFRYWILVDFLAHAEKGQRHLSRPFRISRITKGHVYFHLAGEAPDTRCATIEAWRREAKHRRYYEGYTEDEVADLNQRNAARHSA